MNYKDVASGAIFAAVGMFYGGVALTNLKIGRALNMGPGYFPVILSSVLILLGAAIAGRAFMRGGATPFGAVPWRAIIMLSAATICFAAFLHELGLFPTVLLTAFLAAMASPQISVARGAVISISVAAGCSLIFGYALRLPLPIIGPLFSF